MQSSVVGDAGERVLQDLEAAILLGQLLQEDDVEHDPADGHQAGQPAVQCRRARHFSRHAIGKDGYQDGRQQAHGRRYMRFDVQVIGLRTIEAMEAAGATCLALEAERTLLFDKDTVIARANAAGIAMVALPRR